MKPPSAKSCPACGERYEGDVLFCPKDGTPLANTRSASFQNTDGDAYVGLELAGQIRIKHLIGIGSMGRVYRAFQAGIERDVAVKILHRELSGNAELVARFHREAKVASRLVHPNVVQVLMTGTVPFRADPRVGGEMYLVMEHLDGISLLSALAAASNTGTAALPLPRALHIVLQLCDAVGEAHVQGIVHRDLKPENVMLIKRGEDPDYVKVLDFGIARIDWANQSMATQAGLIFGTAKYISPEGAAGEGVGPPADVYSIATILYQCLAGRAPFEDESPVALLVQHTHAVPPELRSIPRASYVPAPIAEVIMQNLAKKPSARTQDARAFGRDLVGAMRASGLDPEEIIAHSTLLVRGAVRLASHARTKSMDMTPELAQVIASASKAPRLPLPPVPAQADTATAPADAPHERPAPTLQDETIDELSRKEAEKQGAAPPTASVAVAAILVGVRASDTMVVHASELIDVMPPPLPAPPPAEEPEARDVPAEPDASNAAPEAAIAASPEAPVIPAPIEAAPIEPAPIEVAPIEVVPAQATPAETAPAAAARTDVAAPPALDAPAAQAAPDPAAVPAVSAIEPGASADVVMVPVAPVPAGITPPPPSLRTLFDAPAPEAVSVLPPPVDGALAPIAPERAGGTQVGPSPFDGDSIDPSVPPSPSRSSVPGAAPAVGAPAKAGRSPELDWNDETLLSRDGAANGPKPRAPAEPLAPAFQSTMQGTSVESAPEPPQRRSRLPRIVGIVAIAAAAAMSAVAFGQYFTSARSAAQSGDAVDDLVEQARECVRTRSWDSPPGANVKDITARALEQSPDDKRVLDVRHDASEKIVTEALGLKYAGEREDALRLAKLALELQPALVTAQRLVAEIEQEVLAAAPPATATADAKSVDRPPSTAKTAAPKSSGKASLPPTGTTLPASALPSSKGSASTVAPAKSGKATAPPKGSDGPAVLPPTNTGGPWL